MIQLEIFIFEQPWYNTHTHILWEIGCFLVSCSLFYLSATLPALCYYDIPCYVQYICYAACSVVDQYWYHSTNY